MLMSFSEGTGGLSEHAAPGEAMVFALEGEAVIQYEGVDHVIHAEKSSILPRQVDMQSQQREISKWLLLISLA